MPEAYFVQDDGYTLWGFVPRRPGLYPDAWFRYRPAVPSLVRRFSESFGAARDGLGAELVATRVDGLRQKKGDEPTPIPAEHAGKLHADLFTRIVNHVLGIEGPYLEESEKNSAGG
jgi:hypothetical protein